MPSVAPGKGLSPAQQKAAAARRKAQAAKNAVAFAKAALDNANDMIFALNSAKENTLFGIGLNSYIIRDKKGKNISWKFEGNSNAPFLIADQVNSSVDGWAPTYLSAANRKKALTKWNNAAIALRKTYNEAYANSQKANGGTGGTGGTGGSSTTKFIDRSNSPAEYNIGTVSDAYFTGVLSGTESKNGDFGLDSSSINDWRIRNKPISVRNAQELWKKAGTSKGMLQTWMPPESANVSSTVLNNTNSNTAFDNFSNKRYGFQFLYNPGSVSMTFGGVPNIDIAWVSSGKDQINLANPDVSQSSVSFDIVINRIPDMNLLANYADSTGKVSASKIASSTKHPKNVWSGRKLQGSGNISEHQQYAEALNSIKDQGTMYDVEFLLKTLLGIEAYTTLRPGVKTADLGFLAPKPVELHLGKSLRYLVYIEQFNVNHVIFNEDMVPLFTTLSITAKRVPDITGNKK